MFERNIDGMDLRFHLAGINNQNFLMRDEQTGSFWQQINGLAISGPMKGRRLVLVSSDEISYGIWKREQPAGSILEDAPAYAKEYVPSDWDVAMAKVPTVLNYAQPGIKPRDLMVGVHQGEAARAFPFDSIVKEKLIQDLVGTLPIIVLIGPDNRSVRVFEQRIPGRAGIPQFYRVPETKSGALLMDAETGSEWNFQGCAISGVSSGTCLVPVDAIKDYWFDWKNYNAGTTVFPTRSAAQPRTSANTADKSAGTAAK